MRPHSALASLAHRAPGLCLSASLMLGAAGAQQPPGPAVNGFWLATNDDGSPSAWFYFTERDGVHEGRIVKTFRKANEAPAAEFCVHCPGDRKNAPILGLVIVTGMKKHGQKYDGGGILDPRDGTIYHANMEVSPDGRKLFLRGYVGLELFGQTQTWTRLPDDALPAGAIPGATLAATPAAGAEKKKPPARTPADKTPAGAQKP